MQELCDAIALGPPADRELSVDLFLSGFYDIPLEEWMAMVKFLRKSWFWRV
jgi:hypothetical protein